MRRIDCSAASFIAVTVIMLHPNVSQAVLVVGWDVDPLGGGTNNYGPSPYVATSTAAGLSVVGLTRGSGVTQSGTAEANGWGGTGFATGSNLAARLAGDFILFSLTPNAGTKLSLSSIDPYNIRRSATGPTTGLWQYAVGESGFTNLGSEITWGDTTDAAGNAQPAITLSGIGDLQNVVAGVSVTFRIVIFGASDAGGAWYINDPPTASNDLDLSIQGTVTAVPEPGAVLFGSLACGFAGLGFVGRRLVGWLLEQSAV